MAPKDDKTKVTKGKSGHIIGLVEKFPGRPDPGRPDIALNRKEPKRKETSTKTDKDKPKSE